jgi:hypothetical protein
MHWRQAGASKRSRSRAAEDDPSSLFVDSRGSNRIICFIRMNIITA